MEKRKLSAKEVLEDIRSGISDHELMKKYDLSLKGLQSLFKKLQDCGLVTEAELYQRSPDLAITLAIDPTGDEPPAATTDQGKKAQAQASSVKTKKKISAPAVVADIRSRMSAAELMEKYGVSAERLQSLFTKLVAGGHISRAELDARRAPVVGTVQTSQHREDEPLQPVDHESERQPKSIHTAAAAEHGASQNTNCHRFLAWVSESIKTFIIRMLTMAGGIAGVWWVAAIYYKGMTVEALAPVFFPVVLLICLGAGFLYAMFEFLFPFLDRFEKRFFGMFRRQDPAPNKTAPRKLNPAPANQAERILAANSTEDPNPAKDDWRQLLAKVARGVKEFLIELANYTVLLVHRIRDGLREGSWCEDRRVVILLLIFLFPVGLYALWKTSKFQTKTKVFIAGIASVVAVLLFPKVAILWVISVVTLGIYDFWRHSQLRLINRGIVTVAIAAVVVGWALFPSGQDRGQLRSPSKPSKQVQAQPTVRREKPAVRQSSLGSDRPGAVTDTTRQPSLASTSHSEAQTRDSSKSPVYVDPRGYFKIVPPSRWRTQKYPQDPRGKVGFIAPGNQTDLRVLAKAVDIHDFDGLVQSLKEIETQLGVPTNIEPIVFNGLPAFKRVATISLQGVTQKILWIDLLIAGVSHNLQYGAPPSTFDKHYGIAWQSMLTYEPLKRENASSPEQATKHEAAKWIRLAEIALGMGKIKVAKDAVAAGLEADPDNAELKRLKLDLEKR